jgi:hypothetical protein
MEFDRTMPKPSRTSGATASPSQDPLPRILEPALEQGSRRSVPLPPLRRAVAAATRAGESGTLKGEVPGRTRTWLKGNDESVPGGCPFRPGWQWRLPFDPDLSHLHNRLVLVSSGPSLMRGRGRIGSERSLGAGSVFHRKGILSLQQVVDSRRLEQPEPNDPRFGAGLLTPPCGRPEVSRRVNQGVDHRSGPREHGDRITARLADVFAVDEPARAVSQARRGCAVDGVAIAGGQKPTLWLPGWITL